MSNFWMRTLTGALFLVIMIGGIIWRMESYLGLFILIAALGLWEFYRLMHESLSLSQRIAGLAFGLFLLAAASAKYFLASNPVLSPRTTSLLLLIFPSYLIFRLFRPGSLFGLFSPFLFGIFYVIFPFCLLILSFTHETGGTTVHRQQVILGYFMLIWSNDTFAYLTGRAFGKNKLFERISPKKTWEGFAGGVLCTIALAHFMAEWFGGLLNWQWMIMAAIVATTGTLGDLAESMLKRSLGVKDSGTILPGHGGILDRFDAVLLSAPFLFVFLEMIS